MPRSIDPATITVGGGQSTESTSGVSESPALLEHLTTGSAAHPATAIDVDSIPPVYTGTNVEAVLDELSALVPQEVPGIGELNFSMGTIGVPDWGNLKLEDSSFVERGDITTTVEASEIFPYYYTAPALADDGPPGFVVEGRDPVTDSAFNVLDGGYTGGGPGEAHAGAFTRDVGGTPTVILSHRIMPVVDATVVSGVVSPADRGVLALVRWDPGTPLAASTTPVELGDRVLAALLLGGGLNSISGDACDGGGSGPGVDSGIAFYGVDDNPFNYPGKASGQYNLREIHEALRFSGGALPAPFDVADDTAGQVRLGTDPVAGAGLIIVNGIPILGASTVARGGGDDDNFFAYRVPYLTDYVETTGLRYTPEIEKDRYFNIPAVAGVTELATAGNYPQTFAKDYWSFQLARYRHRFTFSGADVGSFALIHFKTESGFEAFARDGVAPTVDDVHSADFVDGTDAENLDNLGVSNLVLEAAPPYHSFRGSVYQDVNGTDIPVIDLDTWDYVGTVDEVQFISGVQYFTPRVATSTAYAFTVDTMSVRFENDAGAAGPGETGFWENTYSTHDSETDAFGFDPRARVDNKNPVVLSTTPFSGQIEVGVGPTMTWVPGSNILSVLGSLERQRVEIPVIALNSPTLGSWGDPSGPVAADFGAFDFADTSGSFPDVSVLRFEGDLDEPRFSGDARFRTLVRRPLYSSDVSLGPFEAVLAHTSGDAILFHSSRQTSGLDAEYGNFINPAPPIAYTGVSWPNASAYTARKDVEERFLDEVYRYNWAFIDTGSGSGTLLPALDVNIRFALFAPGMSFGIAPIKIPVRAFYSGEDEWMRAAWLAPGLNLIDLNGTEELQVSGLPDRSPPITDGVDSPTPSSGLLRYPTTDYIKGHRPVFPADIGSTQFDYSICTGDRKYIRVFDAGFSRFGLEDSLAGTSEFIIRLRGITLEDIKFAGAGPGSLAMAVFVKVPGVTTWMDAGRPDGDGPDKQHLTLDGAGCLMVDAAETLDGIDSDGVVFTQLRINAAPAELFLNNQGEIPVLVKVMLKDSLTGRLLNFTQGGPDASNNNVRGLVGINMIRQDDAFVTTATLDRRFDTGFEDTVPLDTGIITVFES